MSGGCSAMAQQWSSNGPATVKRLLQEDPPGQATPTLVTVEVDPEIPSV